MEMIEPYDNEVDKVCERAEMKAVCAWCQVTIREAKPGHESDPISHGICQRCLEDQKAEMVAVATAKNVDFLMNAIRKG